MTRSEILKMKDSDLDKTIKIQGTRFDRKRTAFASAFCVQQNEKNGYSALPKSMQQ